MTIKEFSDKYDVPYYTAYEASYKVSPVGSVKRDKDFPEDQLFEETLKLIHRRYEKHRQQMTLCMRAEVNMNKRRGDQE